MTPPSSRRPTQEECWDEFWQILGRASARRYLRESAAEEREADVIEVDFPQAA